MTDRPQPPQGHVLVYQELQPDGSVIWMPSIPAGAIRSIKVWCPWTGRWVVPKYICRDRDAVLCYAENYDEETP